MAAYDPKHPKRPVPIARQAACLEVAARGHGQGYWSYLARYSDNAAFMTTGFPDAWAWFDLPEALLDAAVTLALVAELAKLRGDAQVRLDLQAAIAREVQRAAERGAP